MKRLSLALAILLTTGCLVPKKKYDALSAELDSARVEIAARDTRIGSLQEALTAAENKVKELDATIAAKTSEYEALSAERDGLLGQKASLLKDKSAMKASLDEMSQALADLARRRAAAEDQVRQFKDLLGRFQKLIDAGALRIKIVDGRMVVELATDVLFESGRADLSKPGKEAILQVAAILATIPERRFQVEGHTDDVPIQTEKFPSNWELGSARSLTVVKALIEGGLTSERVSGASFSQYRPIGDNKTPEGRKTNRRIEIVVLPDLSMLPGVEELNKAAAEGSR